MTDSRFFTFAALALSSAFITSCHKDDDNVITMDEVSRGIVKVMTVQGKDTIYVDAVDLGLPSELLWATCNIGANQPHENGSFYAWGETAPKDNYNWATYKHCIDDDWSFIKYIKDAPNGQKQERLAQGYDCDNKTQLDKTDDAATANYGKNWFMPTQRDFDELNFRTSKRYGTLNGVPGILLTSNMPGYQDRSIFFPLSGRKDYEKHLNAGKYGFYWSSTLEGNTTAYILWLDYNVEVPNITATDSRERNIGLPIRPITYK